MRSPTSVRIARPLQAKEIRKGIGRKLDPSLGPNSEGSVVLVVAKPDNSR